MLGRETTMSIDECFTALLAVLELAHVADAVLPKFLLKKSNTFKASPSRPQPRYAQINTAENRKLQRIEEHTI